MTYTPGIQEYVEFAKRSVGQLAGLTGLTLAQRRIRADNYAELVREPYPEDLEVRDTFIVLEGREIFARIYRPRSEKALPTVVYFHGGSFVAGSPQGHDFITASIACNTGSQVVSVHYRRSPENPYPAAIQDCYESLCWVARESKILGVDVERLAVAGDSAGGNLAAACALLARDRNGPSLRMQVLIYPTLDADLKTESYLNNKRDAFLTSELMEFALDAYLAGDLGTTDGYALPMRANDHSNLPSTVILVADHDPLLDDGVRYREKLHRAGIEVELRIGKGLIHGFMRARRFCPIVEGEFQAMCSSIRKALDLSAPTRLW